MFARGTAIVSAAAICAGAFALMTQPSASEGTQNVGKIGDRHPAYEAAAEPAPTPIVLPAVATEGDGPQVVNVETKGDLLSADDGCSDQTWPAIDPACLTVANGIERATVRTVSITENAPTATSIVSRVAPTLTAAR